MHTFKIKFISNHSIAIHVIGIVLILTLSACQPTFNGSIFQRLPGILEYNGQPAPVTLPDSAPVDSPIEITMMTYGIGCISQGNTIIDLNGLQADIQPFDWLVQELPSQWACAPDLRTYEHVATVRFAQTGTATVKIIGRAEPNSAPLIVERTIQIY